MHPCLFSFEQIPSPTLRFPAEKLLTGSTPDVSSRCLFANRTDIRIRLFAQQHAVRAFDDAPPRGWFEGSLFPDKWTVWSVLRSFRVTRLSFEDRRILFFEATSRAIDDRVFAPRSWDLMGSIVQRGRTANAIRQPLQEIRAGIAEELRDARRRRGAGITIVSS